MLRFTSSTIHNVFLKCIRRYWIKLNTACFIVETKGIDDISRPLSGALISDVLYLIENGWSTEVLASSRRGKSDDSPTSF